VPGAYQMGGDDCVISPVRRTLGTEQNVVLHKGQRYLPVESVCSRIKNLGLRVQRAGLNSEMCDLRQLT